MKRAWLQIHLSTAVVLMFVAGGLIWANVNGKRGEYTIQGYFGGPDIKVHELYGWPLVPESLDEEEFRQYNGWGDWVIPPLIRWFLDFLVALLILACAWLLCEWWIRRREKHE